MPDGVGGGVTLTGCVTAVRVVVDVLVEDEVVLEGVVVVVDEELATLVAVLECLALPPHPPSASASTAASRAVDSLIASAA